MKSKLLYFTLFYGFVFSAFGQADTSIFEQIEKKYLANLCDISNVKAYLREIDETNTVKKQQIKLGYLNCIEKSENLSSAQIDFIFQNLIDSRYDTTYSFFIVSRRNFN